MATEKLFYKDSFLKMCEATVLECRAGKKGYEIRLDRTVFYPEGGGQACDTGALRVLREERALLRTKVSESEQESELLGGKASESEQESELLGGKASESEQESELLGGKVSELEQESELLGGKASGLAQESELLGGKASESEQESELLGGKVSESAQESELLGGKASGLAQESELSHVEGDAFVGKSVRVLEVHEKDDEIWHFTSEPLEVGSRVVGEIDWEHRFDLMQQHSGEHIVSGMIHARYGYHNVGFHMGAETITIDFDGEIPEQELREIETAVNAYIWENHAIDVAWPSAEELVKIPYRSKKALSGAVRIVTWPGADICACCGVHVNHSGEIGQVVFLSSQRFKGGVRIEMICGKRTQEYLWQLQEQNRRISQLLSAKWKETASAVEKLHKEYQQMKFRMIGMEYDRIARIVKEKTGVGNVLLFENSISAENARKLAADVMEVCGGVCAVFCGTDEDGYRYAIGEKNGDLRALVKEMNGLLKGRGGGKPFFVQGSLGATECEIRAFFAERFV